MLKNLNKFRVKFLYGIVIFIMRVSGKEVAEAILKKLEVEIQEKSLKPSLAIILAGDNPSSKLYVNNKIKAAQRIGINVDLHEFTRDEKEKCLDTIKQLNSDQKINGIIIQYPVYDSWNFDEFEQSIDPQKDVDGFLENSPFSGATALGVWEMLTAFSLIEGFTKTEDFLKDKKIVMIGKGKAAGGPITKLLESKGFEVFCVVKETENPDDIISTGDVVISAAGVKNIVSKANLKKDSYVIGVGVGKETIDGVEKIYGDINEEEVSQIAKLYCPTIGGIGPLTIVCLLRNVVESTQNR